MQTGRFVLAWEAFAICGDGTDFIVKFEPREGPTRVLANQPHEPKKEGDKPDRHRLEVVLSIVPGDRLSFSVDPRADQGCDGIHIIEAKIWEQ